MNVYRGFRCDRMATMRLIDVSKILGDGVADRNVVYQLAELLQRHKERISI